MKAHHFYGLLSLQQVQTFNGVSEVENDCEKIHSLLWTQITGEGR